MYRSGPSKSNAANLDSVDCFSMGYRIIEALKTIRHIFMKMQHGVYEERRKEIMYTNNTGY